MRRLFFFFYFFFVISCDNNVQKTSADDYQKINIKQDTVEVNQPLQIDHLLDGLFLEGRQSKEIQKYCSSIDKKNYQYGWRQRECLEYKWNWVRKSHWGNLIPWVQFGEPEGKEANTTIIFCGVHGDEITPVKFCFDIIKYISRMEKTELLGNRIVVAPLVTPDSYLKKWPTRTNARGVDVNRNFPTKDWKRDAIRLWKSRYRGIKRRFPGKAAKSEQETHFQINLINRYQPSKIISVHAPLTIIDYDGPEAKKGEEDHEGQNLLVQLSKKADGYKVKNYPFFPGSLGNWAGNERGIPTYTLELPTSDNRNHRKYWKKFKPAIHFAITHKLTGKDLVKK